MPSREKPADSHLLLGSFMHFQFWYECVHSTNEQGKLTMPVHGQYKRYAARIHPVLFIWSDTQKHAVISAVRDFYQVGMARPFNFAFPIVWQVPLRQDGVFSSGYVWPHWFIA